MRTINVPFKITKVDEDERRVWGVATSDALDSQGDVLDYEASKKAVNDWMKIGNIREMHDSGKAVGKAFDVEFDDVKKTISVGAYISKSTDGENTWQKVKEGILTGYSVGGAVHKSVKQKLVDKAKDVTKTINRVTDWSMSELSLVDNPANPTAMLTMVKSVDGKSLDYIDVEMLMKAVDETLEKHFPAKSKPLQTAWWVDKFQNPDEINKAKELYEADQIIKMQKRDFSDSQRKDMADKGQALPDGSFPIANKSDLQNAVKAYGRAKDPAAAKAHIIQRAKALKATSELPDSWNAKNSEGNMKKYASANDIVKDFYGAMTVIDCAISLQWFLEGELQEGDESTANAVQAALDALKTAASSELAELEPEEVLVMADAIEAGKKAIDLAKSEGRIRKTTNVIHGDARDVNAQPVVDTKATAVEGGTPVTRTIVHADNTKTTTTKSARNEFFDSLSTEQMEKFEKLIGGKLPSVPPRQDNPAADRPEDVKTKDDNDDGEDTSTNTDGQPDAATPEAGGGAEGEAPKDGEASDGSISDSADGSADAPTPAGNNADTGGNGTADAPRNATPAASTDTIGDTHAATEPGVSDSADGSADAPSETDKVEGDCKGGDYASSGNNDADRDDDEDDATNGKSGKPFADAAIATLQKSVSDLTDRLNKQDQSDDIAKSMGQVSDSLKKVADQMSSFDERLRKIEKQPLPKRPVASFTEVVKGLEGRTEGETDQSSGMSESEIIDLVKLAKQYETHPNMGSAIERGDVMRKLWKVKDLQHYMDKVK